MNKKGQKKDNTVLYVILAIVAIGGFVWYNGDSSEPADPQVQLTKTIGASATPALNSFTGSWGKEGAKSEVYPVYTVFSMGGSGQKTTRTSDTQANTTSSSVGESLDIYFTGSLYYGDPKLDVEVVDSGFAVPDLEVKTISATTDLVITVYDEDDNVLTADDNGNNTADYASGNLGAGEGRDFYVTLKNNVADKTIRIGAILTYSCGDELDDFEVTESDWTETTIPSGDLRDDFTMYDDGNNSQTCSLKHAYEPDGKNFVELAEHAKINKMATRVTTDTNNAPTANGDSYFGAIFVDFAYDIDEDGTPIGDWYKHNSNADADDIGLNEAVMTSGFNGLDVGFSVEAQ